ncbi:MAG: Hsp20/alpha crystallin family protein [Deltaproteobacteria bacterium]|nr:Hsp20/alpha crystallin family protein [Deltaproteobacteria bacterium]
MSTEREMGKPEQESPEVFKPGQTTAPDVDIFVNDDEILLVADMPGLAKEDLAINLENNTLTIEGSYTSTFAGTPQRKEFDSTDYRRVFTLPKGIDVEKTNAEFKQGVLRLHLPKSASVKPCQVTVKGD